MNATRHQITAERSGSFNGMDWDVSYVITFTYLPGQPDNFGVWPPEPGWGGAEIEFISVDPDAGDHGVFSDLAQAGLIDWAKNWLDENYDACIAAAEQGRQPDPDDARQARIDDGERF